jgi:hypothetical protein
MAGGLMQLVAYGAQDVYLTASPKVTFFQAVYRRHTNFAMETIEQTVNGSPANSGRVSVTVARNGDLIGDMFVELKGNSALVSNTNGVSACWAAERAIKDVTLSIGGQQIDKHYQRWFRLYSEIYLSEDKRNQWAKMTTGAASTSLYMPLIFFFNRNPGLALPLIALQYHEVRLDFDLTDEFETYTDGSTFRVFGNYYFLDTEERRRFAQKGHEYLIEQVQHTGTDTVTSAGVISKRLSFNHPVKELVWCFSPNNNKGSNLWNFTSNTGATEVILESAPANSDSLGSSNCFVPTSLIGVPVLAVGGNGGSHGIREEGAGSSTMSVGPLDKFKLVLNGQDRFKEMDGNYFNKVQSYQHHSGNPMPGIYTYSFALKPEEHQPTGTCNFSRIDNAQVSVTMKDAADSTTMHLFATNYNVLRVQSGLGGLAFSN